ncbi:MAG: hypothetical protein PSX81_08395 [bacterium]|nr:hypothetical protein [bacterium]
MNTHDHHTDQFDLYLNNRLEAGERAKFEGKLLNDEVFNKAFTEHKILVLGINDFGKQALKNYIKEQTKDGVNGTQLKVMRAFYAVAASLVLVIGLVFVYRQFGNASSQKAMEIAAEPEAITVPADTLVQPNTTFMEMEAVKKEESVEMDRVAVQDENAVMQEMQIQDDATLADLKASESAGENAPSTSLDNYKIVSEMKLRDTVLLALYVVNLSDELANKDNVNSEKKLSKAKIPSTYNNNNYNNKPAVNEKADSVVRKKLKVDVVKTDKYNIEYWQSPINFKGYKLVGYTLQLYGLGANQSKLKLYKVDYQLYLRLNGIVYALRSCVDGCAFVQEQDDVIRELILEQN